MDTRVNSKSVLMGILAVIASVAMCLAFIPGAYAAEPAPVVGGVSSHQVEEEGDDVREEHPLVI